MGALRVFHLKNRMRFLYVDTYVHHKNRIGFILMCKAKNIECVITKDFGRFGEEWDLVFIPTEAISPTLFPNAKSIMYGPQNFVFADGVWLKDNFKFPSHCFYNLLSNWVIDVQNEIGGLSLESKSLPFAVDIEKFSPKNVDKEYDCFVYFKSRHSSELSYIENELQKRNLKYIVIKYGSYNEEDYLDIIHKSHFGIWLGRHESQGFALEECLSCNIPLLVWDCKSMFEEYDRNDTLIYRDYLGKYNFKATAIPYWDATCGIVFTEKTEFDTSFALMQQYYKTFGPRRFILKELSPIACIDRLLKEIVT